MSLVLWGGEGAGGGAKRRSMLHDRAAAECLTGCDFQDNLSLGSSLPQ